MVHDDDVAGYIARLRRMKCLGAAFHMARMASEIVELRRERVVIYAEMTELRRRLVAAEAVTPACGIDLAPLVAAMHSTMDELESIAPEVVRLNGSCPDHRLRAVR